MSDVTQKQFYFTDIFIFLIIISMFQRKILVSTFSIFICTNIEISNDDFLGEMLGEYSNNITKSSFSFRNNTWYSFIGTLWSPPLYPLCLLRLPQVIFSESFPVLIWIPYKYIISSKTFQYTRSKPVSHPSIDHSTKHRSVVDSISPSIAPPSA